MIGHWNRRHRSWIILALAAVALSGCDYSAEAPATDSAGGTFSPGMAPVATSPRPAAPEASSSDPVMKAEILKGVVNHIQTAALKPGGDNFKLATQNLNQYFSGTSPAAYTMAPEARAYLLGQLPEPIVQGLESPEFGMPDARHLEDCMLYYRIASRVSGVGDDLSRVRRVFDWMVRQVQLVPPNSLAVSELGQARARPYDVLLRGMAVEDGGSWAERGWLFLALCRQLGLDAALLSYSPRDTMHRLTPLTADGRPRPRGAIIWACAVLIDDKPYLFDTRLGLPVPGPDGQGVATLDDALRDPRVLDQLDLPGESPYGTTRAALLGSPTKIGVLIDSSPGYFSSRMKLLQNDLKGEDRTVLHRDPAAQVARFAEALGPHFGGAKLWEMPLSVYTQLFTDPRFVEASKQALFLYHSDFPLIYARIQQLRGDLSEAVRDYVQFRFAENALMADKKRPISPEVQQALDAHATYFLGLCHLERKNPKQAEFFFRETLKLLPEYGPGRFYYHMYRWGAEGNLGRLNEEKGDLVRAVGYYTRPAPTAQYHGNLTRARALVWRDPTAPLPSPLPPAPTGH